LIYGSSSLQSISCSEAGVSWMSPRSLPSEQCTLFPVSKGTRMLCHNLHEELQLIFIMLYKPVVFLPLQALQGHLWLGFLVPTFWPSDTLVDHSMSQGSPWETFDLLSFLGRSDVCFLLQNQPSSCLKSLSSGHVREDLPLHLCHVLQPFVALCHLAPLGRNKPKPLIPQRGIRADQRIFSVRLSHLRSYLPPQQGGLKVIFWAVTIFSTR